MIFVVEEHIVNGGLGTALLEFVADNKIQCEIVRLGIKKLNPELIGSQEYLKGAHEIDSVGLIRRMMEYNS